METFEKSKSPWRPRPPTLVGSMKLIVRHEALGGLVVRVVEPHELLRLIGWDTKLVRPMRGAALTDYQLVELVSNMCGNAWSAFQYAAVAMAMTACAGKFMRDAGESSPSESSQATPEPKRDSGSSGS
eukprot:2765357-Alexandrium_andersonii.AAC.1